MSCLFVNKVHDNYNKVYLQRHKKCYNLETTFQKKVKSSQRVKFISSYYLATFQIPVAATLTFTKRVTGSIKTRHSKIKIIKWKFISITHLIIYHYQKTNKRYWGSFRVLMLLIGSSLIGVSLFLSDSLFFRVLSNRFYSWVISVLHYVFKKKFTLKANHWTSAEYQQKLYSTKHDTSGIFLLVTFLEEQKRKREDDT